MHLWRAQTMRVWIVGAMNTSANIGGRIDASETTLYLSRTRQGLSIISKERRYWLTQQSQQAKRESSFL
jgi:hypothetical protein